MSFFEFFSWVPTIFKQLQACRNWSHMPIIRECWISGLLCLAPGTGRVQAGFQVVEYCSKVDPSCSHGKKREMDPVPSPFLPKLTTRQTILQRMKAVSASLVSTLNGRWEACQWTHCRADPFLSPHRFAWFALDIQPSTQSNVQRP